VGCLLCFSTVGWVTVRPSLSVPKDLRKPRVDWANHGKHLLEGRLCTCELFVVNLQYVSEMTPCVKGKDKGGQTPLEF